MECLVEARTTPFRCRLSCDASLSVRAKMGGGQDLMKTGHRRHKACLVHSGYTGFSLFENPKPETGVFRNYGLFPSFAVGMILY